LIGIPEALGGSHWLSQWLSPVIKHVGEAPDHATEYMLMAVSLVGVLISIGVAYNKYVKQNHIPIPDEGKRSVLANLSYNKFYVDEIYDAIIRKPLDAISVFFYKIVDNKIVDGIVNGLGWSTNEASKGLRLLQTGNVGAYIFMMVIGIISLLLYTYLSL
jgi:NADH-quinone oxidoreductase subunit L